MRFVEELEEEMEYDIEDTEKEIRVLNDFIDDDVSCINFIFSYNFKIGLYTKSRNFCRKSRKFSTNSKFIKK